MREQEGNIFIDFEARTKKARKEMAKMDDAVGDVVGDIEKVGKKGTIPPSFSRNLDQVSNMLWSVSPALAEATEGASALSGVLGGMSPAVVGATAGIAGLGVAAGVVGTKAVSAAGQVELATKEISTLSDQSEISAKEMGEALTGMSTDVIKSTGDLTESMYQAISAGVDIGDSLGYIKEAATAATAGLTDTSVAVDVGTSIMNAMGLEVEDSGRIFAQLFETVRIGKTRFNALASSIGRVLPFASELGMTTEETFAAIAELTRAGLSTRQAVTALSAALSGIIRPTEKTKKIASELGLSFNKASVESKGLAKFMQDVSEAMRNSGRSVGELVSQKRAMLAWLNLGQKRADEFASSIERIGKAVDTHEKQAEKIKDTWVKQLEQMQLAWEAFLQNLGSGLLPVATDIVKMLNNLFEDNPPQIPLEVEIAGREKMPEEIKKEVETIKVEPGVMEEIVPEGEEPIYAPDVIRVSPKKVEALKVEGKLAKDLEKKEPFRVQEIQLEPRGIDFKPKEILPKEQLRGVKAAMPAEFGADILPPPENVDLIAQGVSHIQMDTSLMADDSSTIDKELQSWNAELDVIGASIQSTASIWNTQVDVLGIMSDTLGDVRQEMSEIRREAQKLYKTALENVNSKIREGQKEIQKYRQALQFVEKPSYFAPEIPVKATPSAGKIKEVMRKPRFTPSGKESEHLESILRQSGEEINRYMKQEKRREKERQRLTSRLREEQSQVSSLKERRSALIDQISSLNNASETAATNLSSLGEAASQAAQALNQIGNGEGGEVEVPTTLKSPNVQDLSQALDRAKETEVNRLGYRRFSDFGTPQGRQK